MEVELFTDDLSDDENYLLDDKIQDYLDVDEDGERCGICMEIVIDRGVLDCCQHWFCFACIDNWATITSLCPLCQNEFQMITCVPVYDTVGGSKTDEDTNPGGEDWLIEGENNSLSFPSYYIDENAVGCLDEDGCKIRSASVAIEDSSDIDTSIACDSCDKWYHAYCVGFDPDGTCESSWLCPRCIVDKVPPTLDQYSLIRESCQHGLQEGTQVEGSSVGRVSVSITDVGEAAVGVSLVEENEKVQEASESVLNCSEKLKNTSSISNIPESNPLLDTNSNTEPNSYEQEDIYSPIRSTSIIYSPIRSTSIIYSPIRSTSFIHQKIDADDRGDREKTVIAHLHNNPINSVDVKDNEIFKDQEAEFVEPNRDGSLKADKMVHDDTKAISLESMVSDEKESTISSTGAKRKTRENRNADNEEPEANTEARFSQKRIKTERNAQTSKNQTLEFALDELKPIPRRTISNNDKLKHVSKNKNAVPDIMSLVQDPDRSSLKKKREKEMATGLRLKKIMRRTEDGKDSSVLVQELREKIKEAVRNNSSEKDRFDPKLLEAFRVALSVPGTDNRKPTLDVTAKNTMLQKGKVRESLTRKIYGSGGKRKRAWTRECEVEFWKHRCLKTGRPEKFETLKSVLDLLRDDSNEKRMPETEEKQSGSILSRLYLADNSVFPRKNNIVPVSEKGESSLVGNDPNSMSIDPLPKKSSLPQVIVPPIDNKGLKKSGKDKKVDSDEVVCKSDVTKGDKRKWALELLARKTATPGKKGDEKDGESAILKRNYPLLAQLPKDMRPVLAPCRHNKLSMPVRQAQLNRLTEHFLKKANLSLVSKAAETELAVADAVNIEKGLADRSNSKLVYVNLCSQELLKRSDNIISNRSKESNACSTSEEPVSRESTDTNNSSLDMEVDEALRNTGLMSDSPPGSPNNSLNEIGSPKEVEERGPDNILEVDSHPDLDIYGDFEYNLEEDDLFGSAVSISKLQQEDPKIKLVFSSINVEKPDEKDGGAVDSSFVLESQNKTVGGELAVDSETKDSINQVSVGDGDLARELSVDTKTNDSVIQSSVGDRDLAVDSKADKCFIQISACDGVEELSLAECEELYGPDKEPISVKYPETVFIPTGENTVNLESQNVEKASTVDPDVSLSRKSPSKVHKPVDVKQKTSKSNSKPSENNDEVMKKVEAYIKEHIRPLCKSGVITAEQYRWAVGKTTEKVMKYHSKEKNAKFLIKEGEKVKKLAEQYLEAAPLKAKN